MNKLKKYFNDLEPEEFMLFLALGVPIILLLWSLAIFVAYKMLGG